MPSRPVSPTIQAPRIGATQPYQLPAPIDTATAQGNLSLNNSSFANFLESFRAQQDAQATATAKPLTEQEKIYGRISEIRGIQATQGQRTQEIQEDERLFEKKAAARKLEDTIMARQKAFADRVKEIRKSQGGTVAGAEATVRAEQRDFDSNQADLAIQYKVAAGDYNDALDIVQSKIDAEFEPLKNELATLEQQSEMIKDDLSESEKIYLQEYIAQQKSGIADLASAKTEAYKIAINNGAPAGVLQAIGRSQSPDQAFQAIQGYGENPGARAGSGMAGMTVNDITSPEEIRNLPVSDLTKAVMSGYGKIKDLTPTDKSKVLTEMYQVGFNPQTYIVNKLNNLADMWSSLDPSSRGLVSGTLKFWQKYTNPNVAEFESARTVLTREIARLNDVGMLSDQDVSSYEGAMPSRKDESYDVVLRKILGLTSTVTGKKGARIGQRGTLKDGRSFVVGPDGETLLDPSTGQPLK